MAVIATEGGWLGDQGVTKSSRERLNTEVRTFVRHRSWRMDNTAPSSTKDRKKALIYEFCNLHMRGRSVVLFGTVANNFIQIHSRVNVFSARL